MNAYTFSDVLIKPKYSEITSRSLVDISTNFGALHLQLPIISANMKTITEVNMARTMFMNGGFGILHRFNTIEENVQMYRATKVPIKKNKCHCHCDHHEPIDKNIDSSINVGVSVGVQEIDKKRFDSLYQEGANIFCIDVAHGHHVLVKNMIHWIRQNYPKEIMIIAGNVSTGDGAYDLADWGANVIKVGVGPGSACATRQKTGVGSPQLYALEDVYTQLKIHGKTAKIVADGGITHVGDIAKALKFADAVMLGSMIAGTSETPGNVYKDFAGQFYKVYGGSASAENKGENRFVEGVMKTIPFKGKVKYILREIEDGIRSAFSYVGANNLQQFQKKCEFIFITNNASKESKY